LFSGTILSHYVTIQNDVFGELTTVFREVENTSALWFLLKKMLGKLKQIECDGNKKKQFEVLVSDLPKQKQKQKKKRGKEIIMDKWVKTELSWLRLK